MQLQKLQAEVYIKFGGNANRSENGLAQLSPTELKEVMSEQRQAFYLKAASTKEDGESDTDVPPEHGGPEQGGGKAETFFAPDGRWRRPSDYVAHLASEFEAGSTTLPGKKKKSKFFS